jgi:hypothetical protein
MSKKMTSKSLGVKSERDNFDRTLQNHGIDQGVLTEAMDAASSVLAKAGARAVVENLGLVHTSQEAGACRCVEYEILHLPVQVCDSSGCRTEYRTTQRCVRWSCD